MPCHLRGKVGVSSRDCWRRFRLTGSGMVPAATSCCRRGVLRRPRTGGYVRIGRLRSQAYAARAAPWMADWSSRAQRTRDLIADYRFGAL